MPQRKLTITMSPQWESVIRAGIPAFSATDYQGETLNFESPATFFGRLTDRRWALLQVLIGAGELGLRETARRVGRDVKRVSEDIEVLAELGLVERTASGGVHCPFEDIHVDLHLGEGTRQAA